MNSIYWPWLKPPGDSMRPAVTQRPPSKRVRAPKSGTLTSTNNIYKFSSVTSAVRPTH